HADLQLRKAARELHDRAVAMILEELLDGPVPPSLAGEHVVPPLHQRPCKTTQKMSVAVAPVTDERMGKEDDPHRRGFRRAWVRSLPGGEQVAFQPCYMVFGYPSLAWLRGTATSGRVTV